MKTFTPKGEQSRRRIMRVSTRLFARQGFAGTSVHQIVSAAGVNKRMVYHYFGSKEKLYQAVLSAEYRKLEELETRTLHPDDSIEETVASIVTAYFDFLQANSEFVQLLLWENLNRGRNLDRMEIPLTKSPMLGLLTKAINKGKENGTVRPEVTPRFLLISLIGNCIVYCSNRYTLSRALDTDLSSPRVLGRAKKAVVDLLLNGIVTAAK